jgi:hypothetical protein
MTDLMFRINASMGANVAVGEALLGLTLFRHVGGWVTSGDRPRIAGSVLPQTSSANSITAFSGQSRRSRKSLACCCVHAKVSGYWPF